MDPTVDLIVISSDEETDNFDFDQATTSTGMCGSSSLLKRKLTADENDEILAKKQKEFDADEEIDQVVEELKRREIINNYFESKFDCPICFEVVIEPVQPNTCRHVFCSYCIYKSIEINDHCPTCFTRIKKLVTPPVMLVQLIDEYMEMNPDLRLPPEEIERRTQQLVILKANFERGRLDPVELSQHRVDFPHLPRPRQRVRAQEQFLLRRIHNMNRQHEEEVVVEPVPVPEWPDYRRDMRRRLEERRTLHEARRRQLEAAELERERERERQRVDRDQRAQDVMRFGMRYEELNNRNNNNQQVRGNLAAAPFIYNPIPHMYEMPMALPMLPLRPLPYEMPPRIEDLPPEQRMGIRNLPPPRVIEPVRAPVAAALPARLEIREIAQPEAADELVARQIDVQNGLNRIDEVVRENLERRRGHVHFEDPQQRNEPAPPAAYPGIEIAPLPRRSNAAARVLQTFRDRQLLRRERELTEELRQLGEDLNER